MPAVAELREALGPPQPGQGGPGDGRLQQLVRAPSRRRRRQPSARAVPDFLDFEGRRIAYRLRGGARRPCCSCPATRRTWRAPRRSRSMPLRRAPRLGACSASIIRAPGRSSGEFADGTLARWLDEALAVIDALTEGPLVLVGSSMGGWIALHVALAGPSGSPALVGIAAAPDFTDWGFTAGRSDAARGGPHRAGQSLRRRAAVTTRGFWESRPGAAAARRARSRSIARCGCSTARPTRTCRSAIALRLCAGSVQPMSRSTSSRAATIACREPHEIEAMLRADRRTCGASPMILAPRRSPRRRRAHPAACPDVVTAARRSSAARWRRSEPGKPRSRAPQAFEQAAAGDARRGSGEARGCWPRPAICGSPPASRARRRSRSTARWPAPGLQSPSSAAKPCSTGPGPPKRRAT